MLKYDNIDDFVEVNWAGVKKIMAIACNVSHPRLVANAVAGVLEYYCLSS